MMGFGKKTEGKMCHHTEFKKPCCKDLCPKWIRLQGVNPQNGATVDEYACSDTWLPILLVEVSQKLVKLDATTHNMNNELAKANTAGVGAIQSLAQAAQAIAFDREVDRRAKQIGAN